MAKLPKDLKESTWKDLKATTLTGTGVSDSLRKWAAAEAALQVAITRNKAGFAKALAALDDVETQIAAALKKASSVVHAATKTALKEYPKLTAAARKSVEDDQAAYESNIKNWVKVRKQCKKAMTELSNELAALIKGQVARVLKQGQSLLDAGSKDVKAAQAVIANIDDTINDLNAFEPRFRKTLEGTREGGTLDTQCHVDDRPAEGQSLFDDCNNIQRAGIADRQNAVSDLQRLSGSLAKIK